MKNFLAEKLDDLKVVLGAVVCLFTMICGVVGWYKYASLPMLIVCTVATTFLTCFLEDDLRLPLAAHFVIWCIAGAFMTLPFYVVGMLAIDIGMIVLVVFLLLGGLWITIKDAFKGEHNLR